MNAYKLVVRSGRASKDVTIIRARNEDEAYRLAGEYIYEHGLVMEWDEYYVEEVS